MRLSQINYNRFNHFQNDKIGFGESTIFANGSNQVEIAGNTNLIKMDLDNLSKNSFLRNQGIALVPTHIDSLRGTIKFRAYKQGQPIPPEVNLNELYANAAQSSSDLQCETRLGTTLPQISNRIAGVQSTMAYKNQSGQIIQVQ